MSESEEFKNILYVDDEMHNLTAFKAGFRRKYNIYTALTAAEAVEVLKQQDIHVLITDQRMPNVTGIEFLESIIPLYPDIPRILLTGYADINAVIEAINKGSIFKYIQKPWDEQELSNTINSALDLYKKKKNNDEITEKLKETNEQLEFLLRQKLLS